MMTVAARVTVAISVVALIALVLPASALGYKTFPGNYRLKYGVGNYWKDDQHYFVTKSAASYDSVVDKAVNDWVFTTKRLGIKTPISYTQTTVQKDSRMDVYWGRYIDSASGVCGLTDYYASGNTYVGGGNMGDAPWANWVWCKIRLNDPNFTRMGTTERKGVVAHEMGHVMGLAHVSSKSAVMYTYEGGVNDAQADDLAGINYLY